MEKNTVKSACELLMLGGSAGGLEVLLELLPTLKPGFSFSIVIVLHRGNHGEESALLDLLAVKTRVRVVEVEDKDTMEPGIIYLVPKDYHLLCENDRVFSLDASEKVNFSRPSIDVTFESAAAVYGPALVGIVLSGGNGDGTEGLKRIKEAGGVTIVQSPDTSRFPQMPENAIKYAPVDHIFNVSEIINFVNGIT